jgi:glycosyltransferase involved in cell wall biosynthesis
LRILFCPAHYLYEDGRDGSELSWAYNIADRVASQLPSSVVVTGRSMVHARPYVILELTPWENRVNFGLRHALTFNARYTRAANNALEHERFDVLHHVLPFAVGKTHNLAALRHRAVTPYVIGPVQPSIVRDTDIDPNDLRSFEGRSGVKSARRAVGDSIGSFASDVVGPLAFSRLSRRTIAGASALIAVNEDARHLLIRSGASPDRVVLIPPGIDTRRFRAGSDRTPSSTVEILCVSRLLRRKNVDLVMQAFADVSRRIPEVRLRIVGDGPERPRLTRLAGELDLGEKVAFTGFIPNAAVHEEYHRADIFVNASAAEGFATTCLEALASGLPVVSTNVGGFVDAVQDGKNGYLVSAPDAGNLAAKLSALAENPTLIAELSRGAREVAERKFDWDAAVIPRYRALYERVIQERQQGDARATVKTRGK